MSMFSSLINKVLPGSPTKTITKNTFDKWIAPEHKDSLEGLATMALMPTVLGTLGVGGSTTVGQMLSGAGVAAATGGDPLKGAILAGIGAVLPGLPGDTGKFFSSDIGKVVTSMFLNTGGGSGFTNFLDSIGITGKTKDIIEELLVMTALAGAGKLLAKDAIALAESYEATEKATIKGLANLATAMSSPEQLKTAMDTAKQASQYDTLQADSMKDLQAAVGEMTDPAQIKQYLATMAEYDTANKDSIQAMSAQVANLSDPEQMQQTVAALAGKTGYEQRQDTNLAGMEETVKSLSDPLLREKNVQTAQEQVAQEYLNQRRAAESDLYARGLGTRTAGAGEALRDAEARENLAARRDVEMNFPMLSLQAQNLLAGQLMNAASQERATAERNAMLPYELQMNAAQAQALLQGQLGAAADLTTRGATTAQQLQTGAVNAQNLLTNQYGAAAEAEHARNMELATMPYQLQGTAASVQNALLGNVTQAAQAARDRAQEESMLPFDIYKSILANQNVSPEQQYYANLNAQNRGGSSGAGTSGINVADVIAAANGAGTSVPGQGTSGGIINTAGLGLPQNQTTLPNIGISAPNIPALDVNLSGSGGVINTSGLQLPQNTTTLPNIGIGGAQQPNLDLSLKRFTRRKTQPWLTA